MGQERQRRVGKAASARRGRSFPTRARVLARWLIIVALFLGLERTALAQQRDPRFAIDRYQPADRGSDWFANESLDLRGALRPSFGSTIAYAYRSFVTVDSNGDIRSSPVRNLAIAHVGGSVVLLDRVRLSLNMPFQLFADGHAGVASSQSVPAPAREQGVGDLGLGATVRVAGKYRDPLEVAIGLSLLMPTGQQSQWMGDGNGDVRVRPRLLAAGEVADAIAWAAQISIGTRTARADGTLPPGGETLGADFAVAGAVGARLLHRTVVVGPEIVMSTIIADAFGSKTTSVEGILGAHWLNADQFRVGAGVGRGVTDFVGSPALRVFLSAEWAPPAGRDSDGDGILDTEDACPRLYGRRRSNPKKNGCPPDRDGDGVYDPEDACIDVPGVRSLEKSENGCPPDRDHDGIPDDVDACPDRRGPKSNDPLTNGCPADSDRDGVPDAIDACRDVIGVPTNDPLTTGCPPDTDGDGIDDLNDACPNLAGPRSLEWQTNGCPDPDRDKDSIPNDVDACPDEAGAPDPIAKRNGCPLVFVRGDRIELREQPKWRGSSSAELAASDLPILEAVRAFLDAAPKKTPPILIDRMRIEGHTDDRGDAGQNKKLSVERALAMKKWLVAHGVEASRIETAGFGAERPADTNETEAGRANNRRIEIHLLARDGGNLPFVGPKSPRPE